MAVPAFGDSRFDHVSDVLDDPVVSDCFVTASCCLLNGHGYADCASLVVLKESPGGVLAA